MTAIRTFANYLDNFLDTDQAGRIVDPAIRDRLRGHAGSINSLSGLQRWAKERFPDRVGLDPRKANPLRDSMARLWAGYLTWAEEDPEPVAMPRSGNKKRKVELTDESA